MGDKGGKFLPQLGNTNHDNPYTTSLTVVSLVMVGALVLIWQASMDGNLVRIVLSTLLMVALAVVWILYKRRYDAWERDK